MYMLESKQLVFDSAHKIEDYDGKCNELHGHTWKVKAKLKFGSIDNRNISVDFSIVKKILKDIIDNLDHEYLNAVLDEKNVTCEIVSRYIYNLAKQFLPMLYSITVQEGEGGSCEYYESE